MNQGITDNNDGPQEPSDEFMVKQGESRDLNLDLQHLTPVPNYEAIHWVSLCTVHQIPIYKVDQLQ